jgi:hypothetical protein
MYVGTRRTCVYGYRAMKGHASSTVASSTVMIVNRDGPSFHAREEGPSRCTRACIDDERIQRVCKHAARGAQEVMV